MNTKLTIQLDSSVIEKAKSYAQSQKTSLSKMIESYLRSVATSEKKKNKEIEISPLVKRLSGIIELSNDFDYKKDYPEYLSKKYE